MRGVAIRLELRDELMKLPPKERLLLGDELLDNVLEEDEDPAWEKERAEEIRRRIEQIRAGNVEGIDPDQVFADELARLEPAG